MTVSSVPGLNTGGAQFATPAPVHDPSSTLGAISSSEWTAYMQHFVPLENMLIQYAMNPQQAATNMQTAEQLQDQSNRMATGIQERQLQQFDVTLTPEQKAAAGKARGIMDASSMVTAANKAKDATVANQMGILGASMTGVTGNI